MKILYLSIPAVSDENASSGTAANIKRALESTGSEVYVIDNLESSFSQFVAKVIRKVSGKQFDINRNKFILKTYERKIIKIARILDYDIIFSNTSLLCAYYMGDKPIVYYTDATFGGMLNYYFNADSWINFNIKQGMEIENRALNNCSLAIFASKWAAETAIKYHDASENKICVINRGANVDVHLSLESLIQSLHKRNVFTKEDTYRILFVGRDWERKGGPLALDIVIKLNDLGIRSKLIIIGCTPKIPFEYNGFAEVIGFLNRNIEEEYAKLQEYFLSSDLYLQPSRKECQGIAYLEASAYGLPIIATDTGGYQML